MRSYTCKKLTWEKVMKQWIAKSYSKSWCCYATIEQDATKSAIMRANTCRNMLKMEKYGERKSSVMKQWISKSYSKSWGASMIPWEMYCHNADDGQSH
jgi:hypothetical protein